MDTTQTISKNLVVESDEARRLRILRLVLRAQLALAYVVAALYIPAFWAGWLTPAEFWQDMLLTFPISIVVFHSLLYLAPRRPGLIAWLVVIYMTVGISLSDTPYEVTDGRTLFYFVLPILIAGAAIAPWASFVAAGLTVAAIALVGLLSVGYVNLVALPAMFVVGAMVYVMARTAQNALNAQRTLSERLDDLVDERTTELHAANARLRAVVEDLTHLDELKTKFVADVTHELKSPLTSVRLFLQNIDDPGQVNETTLKLMRDETNRLTLMIQDILSISRIEMEIHQTTQSAKFSPVYLDKLTAATLAENRVLADGKGVRLLHEPGDVVVMGHEHQIKQVIVNLVANAVQYTPRGTVTVRTFSRDGDAFLVVADSGLGIAVEDQPYIFTRFFRGRLTESLPGTGLGLAIVKEIVDAHAGEITLESVPGKGTTFTVRLQSVNGHVQPQEA